MPSDRPKISSRNCVRAHISNPLGFRAVVVGFFSVLFFVLFSFQLSAQTDVNSEAVPSLNLVAENSVLESSSPSGKTGSQPSLDLSEIRGQILGENFGYLYDLTIEWSGKRTFGIYFYEFLEEFANFEIRLETDDLEEQIVLTEEEKNFKNKTQFGFFDAKTFESNPRRFSLLLNDEEFDSIVLLGNAPESKELSAQITGGFLDEGKPVLRMMTSVGSDGFSDSTDPLVLAGPHILVEMMNFNTLKWEPVSLPAPLQLGVTHINTISGKSRNLLRFAGQARFRVSKVTPFVDFDFFDLIEGRSIFDMQELKVRWEKETLQSGSISFK